MAGDSRFEVQVYSGLKTGVWAFLPEESGLSGALNGIWGFGLRV